MNSPSLTPNDAIGRSLLVSCDPATIEQITECMRGFAITTEVCSDVTTALRLLSRNKFEAVVVDLKVGEDTDELLEQIRFSPANVTAVTFAIANRDGPRTVPRSGTKFVMERPLSKTSVDKTLKAAFGLIVREHRRYFRCPLTIPITVKKEAMEVIHCQTLNISEGGLALTTIAPLRPGAQVGVGFTLPGQLNEFAIESEVCWYRDQGQAGLHFLSLPPNQQSELQEWLSHKLEESLPEDVANKFLKSSDS